MFTSAHQPMLDDYDEEEQLRVAEELSLLHSAHEILWTTFDSKQTNESIQILESLIEQQLPSVAMGIDAKPPAGSADLSSASVPIVQKLRWYHEKIVRIIQASPEVIALSLLKNLRVRYPNRRFSRIFFIVHLILTGRDPFYFT